ncbi:MAG: hypothetical protein KKB38_20925 [Gammaproteobacteria bacterium]|nr:hypothetical protein [Gammaproteobacteria bacterium]
MILNMTQKEYHPSPDVSIIKTEQILRIRAAINKLGYFREREIMKLRYGIEDGTLYSLGDVARIYNVTRERVRQIEAKAVRRIQRKLLGQDGRCD